MLLIATGDNESLVRSLGESSNKYKLIGLILWFSSSKWGIDGTISGFADMTMGNSIISCSCIYNSEYH